MRRSTGATADRAWPQRAAAPDAGRADARGRAPGGQPHDGPRALWLVPAAGVLAAAGEGFFVNPSDGAHNLRLAYSCATPNDIDAGISILAQVIHRSRVVE